MKDNIISTRKPAEVFPPGEFLREELEERGWTQADLAEIMGRPERLITEIVTGKRRITPETARGLAAAFGTSAEFWLNLEQAYQLWRTPDNGHEVVALRAKLYSYAPIMDMIRRGWIEQTESVDVLQGQVLRFFKVSSLDEKPQPLQYAARQSTSYADDASPAQLAWLFRAKQLAQCVHAAKFAPSNVKYALDRLKFLLMAPSELHQVPRILSDAGVRFVIVQPLPGTKIDGACIWLDDTTPVIAMSVRFDRIDNFWFTLLHELGHCAKGDVSIDNDMDAARCDSQRPLQEREADEFAVKNLVNQDALLDFISRKRPLYSAVSIQGFAYTQKVHPGIVVGQLHYRGEVKYENFRKMLEPVRKAVTASALTDGWGSIVPNVVIS